MVTPQGEKTTQELLQKCRSYLNDNFHKFSQANKIRISLALIQKSMPLEVEGAIEHTVFYQQIIAKPVPNRIAEYVNKN